MSIGSTRVHCAFPNREDEINYRADGLEEYTQIEDYWMKREGIIFYPFNRQQKAYFFPSAGTNEQVGELEIVSNPAVEQEEFETSVFIAQEAMKQGDFNKVVLARNELIKKKLDPLDVFSKAKALYPDAFVYLVDLGWEQWLGASPELLLEYEKGELRTVALAGTQPLEAQFGAKEIEEQQLVEAFIEEKLELLGLEDFDKSERMELAFGPIKHLKTDYSVKASAEQAKEAVKHLHPTSAVCGLPRDKSFNFLSISIDNKSILLYISCNIQSFCNLFWYQI